MAGISAAAVVAAAAVCAAPVDVGQASRMAQIFMSSSSATRHAGNIGTAPPRLAYTASRSGADCFYVFDSGENRGYAIVSADDRVPAVIGYSSHGSFDYDKASPGLKWWLGQYADRIERCVAGDEHVRAASSLPEMSPVEPLLTTLWDQGPPYNDLCPVDKNTGLRCMTGCAATAMAQIMKFHRCPERPSGSAGGVDFSGTVYAWDNMLDKYVPNQYTGEQATAVATLMYQAGMSINMNYGPVMSGAYALDVPPALSTYFGYDRSADIANREYYSYEEWLRLIHGNLKAGMPVLYSGQAEGGGHAFVCDGYDGNGYFHMNWGWSGAEDGYFLLFDLNPASGGAGSFEGGYNQSQQICHNIRPDAGTAHMPAGIYGTGDITFIGDDGFGFSNGLVIGGIRFDQAYNYHAYAIDIDLAMEVSDIDDGSVAAYAIVTEGLSLEAGYGFSEFGAEFDDLPDGNYMLRLVSRRTGTDVWEPVRMPYGKRDVLTMSVSDGERIIENKSPYTAEPDVLVQEFEVFGPFMSSAPVGYRIHLANIGDMDFQGVIELVLDNGKVIREASVAAFVPAGETAEVSGTAVFDVEPGRYSLYIGSSLHEPCQPVAVDVVSPSVIPDSDAEVYFSDFSNHYYNVDRAHRTTVSILNLSGSRSVTGDYRMELYRAPDNSMVHYYDLRNVTVWGDQVSYPITVVMDITPGLYYWIVRDSENRVVSCPIYFQAVGGPHEVGGLSYMVYSSSPGQVRMIAPPAGSYEGEIVVPDEIAGAKVVSVAGDAFTWSPGLLSVALPAVVKHLGAAAFYGCDRLGALTLGSGSMVTAEPSTFDVGAEQRIRLSVAPRLANLYKRSPEWAAFGFPSWLIDVKAGVSVSPGAWMVDPDTGSLWTPFYVSGDERLDFNVSSVSGAVEGTYVIGGSETGTVYGTDYVILPPLGDVDGSVSLSQGTGASVGSMCADGRPGSILPDVCDIYSLDGRCVAIGASASDAEGLEPGVYICRGANRTVRLMIPAR